MSHPRNKTDRELRLVAERGGYVGICFMRFLAGGRDVTIEDVVAHLEHAVQICGENQVGIGTDGGTTAVDDLEAFRRTLRQRFETRQALGVAGPGERPDTIPVAADLMGPDQFKKLEVSLTRRGHSRSRIEKIMGANFLRFAEEVWGQ